MVHVVGGVEFESSGAGVGLISSDLPQEGEIVPIRATDRERNCRAVTHWGSDFGVLLLFFHWT
jgi:hypothetical protein